MYKHLLNFASQAVVFSPEFYSEFTTIFLSLFLRCIPFIFRFGRFTLFNFVMVLGVFRPDLVYKVTKGSQKSLNLFLILTIVKMALAIVFLLPVIGGKSDNSVTDVVQFFHPLFSFSRLSRFSPSIIFSKTSKQSGFWLVN